MIHYLVIGHACDEEQEWRHMMFNDEQSDKYLEKQSSFKDYEKIDGWDSDKEVYVDFILKSNSPIKVQYG